MTRRRVYILISLILGVSIGTSACRDSSGEYKDFIQSQLRFQREATLKLLDEIEKTGRPAEALAWRAGPGRAPIGWQIMHLASTEDRMSGSIGGQPAVSESWSDEFKSGKAASGNIPSAADIRKYLSDSRSSLERAVLVFDMKKIDEKPKPDSHFAYRRMFQILLWHEGHHQGQALATFNLYKAANNAGDQKQEP